jgi:hypothetical protein
MTAYELPPNVQEFNEITAVILSQLFSEFPVAQDINADRLAAVLGAADRQQEMASGRPFNKVLVSTLDWLIEEGFVRSRGPLSLEGVVLTTKGIAAMNVVPPSLNRRLGSELADATKEASTEEGKIRLSQMMGNFWGSLIGSFTKSISGG